MATIKNRDNNKKFKTYMETSVNNKCKAFTSLEQSRKLAEILPIESADIAWCNSSIKGINYTDSWHAELKTPIEIESIFNKAVGPDWETWWSIIPCWSLAALLNYLKSKNKFPEIKELSDGCFKLTTFIWDGKNSIQFSIADNLVDACYEMILKLHKEKLI